MNCLYKLGDIVKVILGYVGGYPNTGEQIFKVGTIVDQVDFGYSVLVDGKVEERHPMDLEKINEDR
jgi:hypothetical protein